jgi:hypothetical protein
MTATSAATDGPESGSATVASRPIFGSLAAFGLTALLLISAMGAYSSDLQGSARLVLVTSVVAVLSPLFWPGRAATARSTAWRALGWSFAASTLAAVAILGVGGAQGLASACSTLLLICITTLGVAAWTESLLARRGLDSAAARNASAWLATAMLVITGAAPLWLGPAAELAAVERPRALAAVVAMSPLTHLAIAGGNDLLRNQWFYQHSNLSGLRFDYPRLMPVLAGYAAVSLALVGVPAMARSRRTRVSNSTSSKEQVP